MPVQPGPVTYQEVYYVDSSECGRPINMIAIKPTINGNKITWYDTGRGEVIRDAAIKCEPPDSNAEHTPSKIIVLTPNGDKISLIAMDLLIYNSKVKDYVVGKKIFNTDQELKNWYLTTDFEAYSS